MKAMPTQFDMDALWRPFSGEMRILSSDVSRDLRGCMPGWGVSCRELSVAAYRYVPLIGAFGKRPLPHQPHFRIETLQDACDPDASVAFLFRQLHKLSIVEQVALCDNGLWNPNKYRKAVYNFPYHILTDGEKWCPLSQVRKGRITCFKSMRDSAMLSEGDQEEIKKSIQAYAGMEVYYG